MNIDTERKAFEAYAKEKGYPLSGHGDGFYSNIRTRNQWLGWQAHATKQVQADAGAVSEAFTRWWATLTPQIFARMTPTQFAEAAWKEAVVQFAAHPSPAGESDKRDTAMLEWLASHEAWVAWSKDGETCRVFHRDEEGESLPFMGWKSPWFDNARDAIRAAMSREQSQEKGGERG